MYTAITSGIKISVSCKFEPAYSNPIGKDYMYSYTITIENQNYFSVQLMRRYWSIKDAEGNIREVEGAGVIGLQPIIAPGARHIYTSNCDMGTDMGTMRGNYQMKKVDEDVTFNVRIPEFRLEVPFLLN